MYMKISNFIDFKIFLISLSFGLFLNYVLDPTQKTIFVYPTPDNISDVQIKDHTDKCFQFKAEQIPCPKNEKEIESYNVDGNN